MKINMKAITVARKILAYNQEDFLQAIMEDLSLVEYLRTAFDDLYGVLESVQDFMSANKTIENAGYCDNYKDAAKARARQRAILNKWTEMVEDQK